MKQEYWELLNYKDKKEYKTKFNKYNRLFSMLISIVENITNLLFKIIMFLMVFGLFVKDIIGIDAFNKFVLAVFILILSSFELLIYLVSFIFILFIILFISREVKKTKWLKSKNYDSMFLEHDYNKIKKEIENGKK